MKSVFATLKPQKERVEASLKKKRVLVIAGPTASGKTDLSLSLAQTIGGEILSADSMQVYRGMDIGTAKATPEQRAQISHHLIDLCDLDEPFNVAAFYEESRHALRSIFARDNVPIVVGGSGFYIHVFLYGSPAGPPSVPALRKQLEKQMADQGPEVLYERLQMLDPTYAATISEHDRHKIIRALEIIALSEKKVSDFPKPEKVLQHNCDFRCWFIYYPREKLYGRIEKRCDEMIRSGFLDEVKALEKQGLRQNVSASQAIGYRQALEFLDSPQTTQDLQQFIHRFQRASRNYAKRQFTWFRREPMFRWLNMEETPIERAKELILRDFEQND